MPGSLRASREASAPSELARAVPVLLATNEPDLGRRVAAALDGERFVVHSQPSAFTAEAPPDVIVTDQTLASDAMSPFHGRLMHGEVGVLLIGRSLPADVLLAADFTRRELRLAVRMLAQIVGLRRQNRRLLQLAGSDPLTGLPNRRAIEERFAELQAAQQPVMLALFDLDDFKRINAEFGYLRGDEVLRGAAKTLSSRASEHFVGRLGGDEFVLLGHAIEAQAAMSLAEECRRAIGIATSLKAERPLSASAGLAIGNGVINFAQLLANADTALRRAKQAGGKRTESE